MARKNNSVEVKNFPLLKIAGSPNRGERRKGDRIGAIGGAQSNHDGPLFQGDGVQVIDGLKVTRLQARGLDFNRLGWPPAGSGSLVVVTSVMVLSGQSTPVAFEQ